VERRCPPRLALAGYGLKRPGIHSSSKRQRLWRPEKLSTIFETCVHRSATKRIYKRTVFSFLFVYLSDILFNNLLVIPTHFNPLTPYQKITKGESMELKLQTVYFRYGTHGEAEHRRKRRRS
jgi:hypothetical protein